MLPTNDIHILSDLQANKLSKKDDLEKITKFTLQGLRLKVVPKCINRLTNLTKLDFTFNNITKIPDFVFDLVNLEYLDFSFNAIDYVSNSDSINKLVNLTHLNFENNNISDISISLPKLKYLYLSNNKLKKINLNFDVMTNLEELVLQGNRITNLPEKICSMPQLKTIVVSFNNIHFLPRNFDDFKNLGYLDICGNPFSDFPNIQNLHNLEFLDVNFDKLLTLPHNITELTNLKLLKMRGNDVTIDDIILEHFSKLPSFKITFSDQISDSLKLKLDKYNIPIVNYCHNDFDNAKYLYCYRLLQNVAN